jgi:hypothetical protein
MTMFRNLVLGAIVAAICLAPVAWADANRLLSGQSPGPMLATSASSPAVQTASAVQGAFPHLVACLLSYLPAGASDGR